MKRILGLTVLMLIAQAGWSQEMLGEYKWQELKALPKGATLSDGGGVLRIENTNDASLQVNLLTIEHPKVTAQVYELTGKIMYEAVQGDGFLEMWNYFPPVKPGLPEGEYFSRTMDDRGPMGKISGTSGWRGFVLPFDRTGVTAPPTRLQVNLVLKGRGTVYLGPVKLLGLPKAKSATVLFYPNAWWSAPMTGILFGWGGAVIGCLGGLCGWLGGKGKARGFVLAVLSLLSGLGVVLGIGGLVAVALGQPFFIWLPMLGTAVILVAVCPINLRVLRRRYEEIELRRMASLDASGA
ncbi:MAG: hypothetical protein JWQ04_1001 [Pedosphaera sp.]|nr:hypothetical protein [Pedosphaera sp.]